MTSGISEKDDIHPILRANPFLIEDGAKLVRGEKHPDEETLKRIDLYLEDKNSIPFFVEVKWSSFEQNQVDDYYSAFKRKYGPQPFRLCWYVPEDMASEVDNYLKTKGFPIELKQFSRQKMVKFVELRKVAKKIIQNICASISSPVVVPKGAMYGVDVSFPNIISACYFEGHLTTERGVKKVGLKQQTLGRYLDLIRCICQSSFANTNPELVLILIEELLVAPYYYLTTKQFGAVESGGVHKHILKKKDSWYYHLIAEKVIAIHNEVKTFAVSNLDMTKELHMNEYVNYDLLYRVFSKMPYKIYQMGLIAIGKLVAHLVDIFSLMPTRSLPNIRHDRANQTITNRVDPNGFERDMAKRLIELSVLKKCLIRVSGIPIMYVLDSTTIGKIKYERFPVQNFKLNKDKRFFRSFIEE